MSVNENCLRSESAPLKRFILDFSKIKYLARTYVECRSECGKKFQALDNYLADSAVNECFDKKKETILFFHASLVELSSILLQRDKN